jgi:hypothetical protein
MHPLLWLDGIEIPAGAPTINPLSEQGKIFIFMFFLKFSSLLVSLSLPF